LTLIGADDEVLAIHGKLLDLSTAVDKAIIVQSVVNENGAEIKMEEG
jgi:hypothetical protein